MIIELLISIILSVCPVSDKIETNDCQESIINCAVDGKGNIEQLRVQECLDKYFGYGNI